MDTSNLLSYIFMCFIKYLKLSIELKTKDVVSYNTFNNPSILNEIHKNQLRNEVKVIFMFYGICTHVENKIQFNEKFNYRSRQVWNIEVRCIREMADIWKMKIEAKICSPCFLYDGKLIWIRMYLPEMHLQMWSMNGWVTTGKWIIRG